MWATPVTEVPDVESDALMFPVVPEKTVEFDVNCQLPVRLAVPLTPELGALLPPHPSGAQNRTTRSAETRLFI